MRAVTGLVLIALAAALAYVPAGALPFAQRWESPTLRSAAHLAGFAPARYDGQAVASRAAAIRVAARAAQADGSSLPPGAQAHAALFRARVGAPQWGSQLAPGTVGLMMATPDVRSYARVPVGSRVDVWLVEFTHVRELVVGGPGLPHPDFRAVYVVVDAATDQALVTFAACQRV